MPEGTRPAEEGTAEVGDEEAVLHDAPVRIPFSAMPSRPPSSPGSSFSTTFVLGTAAALWFAAAIVSGGTIPVLFALGWLAVLALDFGFALRR